VKQLDLFGHRPTLREQWADDDAKLKLNSTVAPEDAPRLKAAARRLYEAMKDGAWYTTTQLEQIGGRSAPQRVHEFKAAGLDYECVPVPGGRGEHRWRLIGGTPKASENAS
jgi:hypothetical protein